MTGASEGAGDASRTRVKCFWDKLRELSRLLTSQGAIFRLKGKIYSACVQSVIV